MKDVREKQLKESISIIQIKLFL